MTKEITNSADVIDSRDVIERIKELERMEPSERDEDEENELKALTELAEEAEGAPDWTHGEALIRDSYFEKYAQELADDLGYLGDKTNHWPFNCIDWQRAARELQYDYSRVSFDGVDYWIRN